MNWKTLLFLLLLVGGLFYLVRQQNEAEDQIEQAYMGPLLEDMRRQDVVEIRWDHVERDEYIAMEKHGGRWHLTDPKAYPIAPDRVKLVLDGLFTTAREVPKLDLEKIKPRFDPPRAVITIIEEKEGGVRREEKVQLGGLDPDGMALEVLYKGRYMLILRNVDTALLSSVSDLREKRLFQLTPGRIVEVHRSGFTGAMAGLRDLEFSARREGPHWQQYEPVRVLLDPAAMDLWTRVLASLRVKAFLSDIENPDLSRFGLATPEMRLRLVDAGGQSHELLITEKNGYKAKLADSHHIYLLPDAVIQQLTENWSYLRDTRLIHAFRNDIGHLDFQTAQGVVRLTQGPGQKAPWLVAEKPTGSEEFTAEFPADRERIEEFLGEMEKASVLRWAPPGKELTEQYFGAEAPMRRLTFTYRYNLEGETSSARFGAPIESDMGTPLAPYLRSEDAIIGMVSKDLLDWFDGGVGAWRSPLVWDLVESRTNRVRVVWDEAPDGPATREYIRKIQGTWRYQDVDSTPKELLAVMDNLVYLRAEQYLTPAQRTPLVDKITVEFHRLDGSKQTAIIGKTPEGEVRLETGTMQAVAKHQALHRKLLELFN